MYKPDEDKVANGFTLILEGLGLLGTDAPDQHLLGTPRRAARAWMHELCRGLTEKPPEVTTFETSVDEMVVLRHIPIRSLCAHHLLPFIGEAIIGYIPGTGRLLGLSKLSRIADHFARRPTIQEELTSRIADYIAELVVRNEPADERQPKWRRRARNQGMRGGVGVIIHARHLCMELRGVQHAGDMVTSALRGVFLTPGDAARAEFLQLAHAK